MGLLGIGDVRFLIVLDLGGCSRLGVVSINVESGVLVATMFSSLNPKPYTLCLVLV